jgi:GxxExxY protein
MAKREALVATALVVKAEPRAAVRPATSDDTDDDIPLARIYRGIYTGGRTARGEDALMEHLAKCSIPFYSPPTRGKSSGEDRAGERKLPSIENSSQFEREIVRIVNRVYSSLGNAQNEMVYQRALEVELGQRGLTCLSEWEIPITYDGQRIGCRRADLIVRLPSGARYVLELKAIQSLRPEDLRQLQFYMVHLRTRLGMLINFPRAQSYPNVEGGDAGKLDVAVKMLQGHETLADTSQHRKSGGYSRYHRGRGRIAPSPEIHRVKIGRRGMQHFLAAGHNK